MKNGGIKMERDLDFRKLIKMYLLNCWLMILAGIVVALGMTMVFEGSNENILTKKVFIVYDLEDTDLEETETKKNIYFDTYKGLLVGNVLKDSEEFTDEERSRLSNIAMSVESSCYTVTMTVQDDGNLENDKELFNRWIQSSENWMQDKFGDRSIQVESVYESVTQVSQNYTMKIIIGFLVGAVLMALALFVWFVMDRKVRSKDDVLYYTGVDFVVEMKGRK